MDNRDFFEDIINAVPRRYYGNGTMVGITGVLDRGQVGLLTASLQTEINRLRFYLMDRNSQDREITIERVVNNLFHGYYETRELMNSVDTPALKNDIRRIMNAIYEAVIQVILLAEEIRVMFRRDFITGWASRAAYFPFENLIKIDKSVSTVQADVLRFSNIVNENTGAILLRKLVDGRFVEGDTPIGNIMYWFGGKSNAVASRIKWLATLKDLNVFINEFYPNEAKKWEKAVSCFVWRGDDIKKKSLSTAISSYDGDPESKGTFETLKRELREK